MGIVSAREDRPAPQGGDASAPQGGDASAPQGAGVLAPLLAPIAGLKGVKENEARLIAKAAGGARVLDLLLHLPERYLHRRRIDRPSQALPDAEALIEAIPISHKAARSAQGRPYVRVRAEAGGESLTAFLMNWQKPWAEKTLPVGVARFLAGTLKEDRDDDWVMVNPQIAARAETIPTIQPVWPLTGTLTLDSRWPDGDWRNTYFVPENLKASVERAERLRPVIPDGMSMPELALRFILSNPVVSTVIPGMRKLKHVESNIDASDAGPLDEELIEALRPHRWDRTPTRWSQ